LKLIFAGTPQFAASHLSAIAESHHQIVAVITQPDKPGKRGKRPIASAVKQVALELDLPLIQSKRLHCQDISAYKADLMIVVAYGQILRTDILQAPARGCINVHASLLPRWRGAAPIQRAILSGDTESGVCIMQMDEGLDTGDVLMRASVNILDQDTSADLANKLTQVGIEALLDTLDKIEEGTITAIPQEESGMTYAKKISKKEARIDWHANSQDIVRLVNAFNPDPIAYTQLDTMRVKIWAATAGTRTNIANPGEIINLSKAGLEVACIDGSLLIEAMQLPIGKGAILNGSDLMNARKELLAPGKRFN
jgi:methionyl-tRNA formyltransferase